MKKETIEIHDPSKLSGILKPIAGSLSDDWNNYVANQVAHALWLPSDADQLRKDRRAAVDAMIGIKPNDEIEGMIAAQLIACHNAAMECFRRAMLSQQTFEGRRENLSQANKLSRTYATVLEALNRHRGKGQQKVTVEHIHVHSGAQAIVGTIERTGGGCSLKSEEQPHALGYEPGAAVPSQDTARELVPVTRDEKRPVPDARRNLAGSPERE